MADEKVKTGPSTNLHIQAPRKATGEPIYTLDAILHAQFESVVLEDRTKPGTKILFSTKDGKGQINVGSANFDFIAATIISVLSGRGDVPDGLTLFVSQVAAKMDHLNKYDVLVKSQARGGTYEGEFGTFLQASLAKAAIVVPSLEKFPLPKRIRQKNEADAEPEAVDFVL